MEPFSWISKRNVDEYKKALSIADEPYRGSYDDSRGPIFKKH